MVADTWLGFGKSASEAIYFALRCKWLFSLGDLSHNCKLPTTHTYHRLPQTMSAFCQISLLLWGTWLKSSLVTWKLNESSLFLLLPVFLTSLQVPFVPGLQKHHISPAQLKIMWSSLRTHNKSFPKQICTPPQQFPSQTGTCMFAVGVNILVCVWDSTSKNH